MQGIEGEMGLRHLGFNRLTVFADPAPKAIGLSGIFRRNAEDEEPLMRTDDHFHDQSGR
jgi:hypothetical protein